METIHAYFASRTGLIPTGSVSETSIYNGYCNFARARGEEPVSLEAMQIYIYNQIWGLWWWYRNTDFHNVINNFIIEEVE